MLELLLLGVFHDRQRFFVLFHGDALLVPADRLRLLDQRGDHSGEGPRLGGQFPRRLVILLETHGLLLLVGISGAPLCVVWPSGARAERLAACLHSRYAAQHVERPESQQPRLGGADALRRPRILPPSRTPASAAISVDRL